jgi:hypothetical protein
LHVLHLLLLLLLPLLLLLLCWPVLEALRRLLQPVN